MHRREFLLSTLAASAISCTVVPSAGAWELITNEELEHENAQPHANAFPQQSQPGSPTIEVDQPDVSKPIKVPVDVRVRFLPQDGATVDPNSFRAKYGWLRIDITERILAHAKIDASGLVTNGAELPSGNYSVTLQISDDNLHRIGTRTIEFSVT
jgi:hypothetical protein